MSSSVLENKILHSVLFPHESLHLLPPKVFGSTCFVHNFSLELDKLSVQSHKCVFLGFTRSQKGYKCFSPSLNRYFIFADVTFTEPSFYFKSLFSPLASSSNQIHIPVVCDSPVVPNIPMESSLSPPLKVYSHRQTSQHPPSDSPLVSDLSSPPTSTVELDLPVAIRKGIRSTRNTSPHYNALSYHRLSQPFYVGLSSISSVSIPKSVGDVLAHPVWCQAMLDELNALQNSGTWELISLPSGKFVVGCKWVFAIKVGRDGTIDRLKDRLVAKVLVWTIVILFLQWQKWHLFAYL